jgi:predicted transcriptional regulator
MAQAKDPLGRPRRAAPVAAAEWDGKGDFMSRELPDLAKSEWSLMEALWHRGQATASALQADLRSSQGWAYSTVKTMLDRLVEKGYVKSRRVGNVYEYSPRIRRGAVVARTIDDLAERVLAGSVSPLIHRLVESRRLNDEEIRELRRMLDSYPPASPQEPRE